MKTDIELKDQSLYWFYRSIINKLMALLVFLCFVLILIPLISILTQVFHQGLSSFTISAIINEGGPPFATNSGIKHAIIGTIEVMIISSILGIPIGLLVGVFLAFHEKFWAVQLIQLLIENMISVPTIITGVVVWAFIVKTMGHFSVLAGGVALALVLIPLVAKTTQEMLRLVPQTYLEASYALGIPKTRTIRSIAVPIAGKGIISGILLSIARIFGETAPLLFTAFFSQRSPPSVLSPSATLTVLIYVYSTSPFTHWQNLAWIAAMLLISMNMIIFIFTRSSFNKFQ